MFYLMTSYEHEVIGNKRDEEFEREIFYKLPVSQQASALKMSREIDKLGVKLAEAGHYSFVLAAVFHEKDDEFCERSGILKMVTEHNQFEIGSIIFVLKEGVKMWIRTYTGNYVNSDQCTDFFVIPSKIDGGAVILAKRIDEGRPMTVAQFPTEEDAQKYLDRMMKAFGNRVFEVDMAAWNYSGHKKDHKETRHGGS